MTASSIRATEAQCQAAIIGAARALGWLCHAERPATMQSGRWATPVQGDVGFPDIVLVHPVSHWLLFVELKRKPRKPDVAQLKWLEALTRAGTVAQVVWVPEGVDAFIETLSTLSRSSAAGPEDAA